MTIPEFAAHCLQLHPAFKACYIAIVPTEGRHWLEVEIPGDIIASTYDTGRRALKQARKLADELDNEFAQRGIKVYDNRVEWELHDEHAEGM